MNRFHIAASPATARASAALVLACALAPVAAAQKVCLVATLDGAQEVPPNPSTAKATAVVMLDRSANTLTYNLIYTGLSSAESAAHIHGFAASGVNAGIKFVLPLGDVKAGMVSYAEADEANYLNGLAYFNLHTTTNPGGEIRGQLVCSNSAYTYIALADGAAEVPATASTAKALGWFRFDVLANTLTYSLTRTATTTTETASHIHGFSAPGANAGIKFALPVGPHKSGTLAYPAGDEANYIAGLSYYNLHTTANPGGEIRGQIVAGATNPTTFCVGKLNSQGCMPTAGATGVPQLSGPDNLHITCTNVVSNKSGVMFWGLAPRAVPAPFLGGVNCILSPTIRTPVQSSGGNPPPDDCSGTYDFFFSHAYMAANGLAAGSSAYCQHWYRDPANPDGTGAGLSDAVCFEVIP